MPNADRGESTMDVLSNLSVFSMYESAAVVSGHLNGGGRSTREGILGRPLTT